MGFLYWIDTDRQTGGDQDAPLLRSPLAVRSVGPVKDRTGLLVYPSDLSASLSRYKADEQDWAEFSPGKWVGVWRDAKPGPVSLMRDASKIVEGVTIELGDGNHWILPRLKTESHGSGLPQVIRFSSSGTLYAEPLDKYKSLCRDGERLWQTLLWMRSGDETCRPESPMVEVDIFRLISEVLGVNYRVGPAEVSLLGLVTTVNFLTTAYKLVGVDLLAEAEHALSQEATESSGG